MLTTPDGVGLLVWNFNAKLLEMCVNTSYFETIGLCRMAYFLDRHHNLDSVQAVEPEILVEVGRWR